MRLSVVVVNWSSIDDLRECLTSLRGQTHGDLEIVVVDNGSSDGSVAMVATEFPECLLLEQTENLGFAQGCNLGIERSTGEWVALLNNDAVADPSWAAVLVSAAATASPRCGMLQSLLLYKDRPDTINSTGIELAHSGGGRDRREGELFVPSDGMEEIFCPTAGAAAYRRSMLDAVRLPAGYFDPSHFMYLEDMDLGWRARLAGWSAYYVPLSVALHRWHGSSDRHGSSWRGAKLRTNRLRTLLKNASVALVLSTMGRTVTEMARHVRRERLAGLRELGRAIVSSLATRRVVTRISRHPRREIERRWRAKPT